jgi:hypothetical protein
MTIYLVGCILVIIAVIVDVLYFTENEQKYLSVGDLLICIAVIGVSWLGVLFYIHYICSVHVKWTRIGQWFRRVTKIKILDWRK